MQMKIQVTTGILAALVGGFLSQPAKAQGNVAADAPATPAAWHSENVLYVAGLADVKPDSEGSLRLTPSAISFVGKSAAGEIPYSQITGVYAGDERVATGGTGAKVARHIPFFGFGAAVGAVTNKKIDLLTIEYRDMNGGIHGAVFEIPKTQALIAQHQLSTFVTPSQAVEMQPCVEGTPSDAILVAPVRFTDVEVPAEYRILLYEQLVEQIKKADGTGTVYRVGDISVPCTAKTLQLSVTAFKKGNEAVRSSTGPVGFFVGGTSVNFHVSLTDKMGTVFFEQSMKESKRGDGDSLSVTHDLAKSLSKRLLKAKQYRAPAAS
jgi:hypothetical protein